MNQTMTSKFVVPIGEIQGLNLHMPSMALLGYRGSIAHGLYVPPENEDSIDDIDLMGFVTGDPKHYLGLAEWGSRGTKEIKEGHWDIVLYELRKAFQLLLQGNPNIMSMLWLKPEHRITETSISARMYENRSMFAGKHVYNAFAGYAYQQMLKMESRDPAELREYLAVTAELKYRGAHPNEKGVHGPAPDQSHNEAKDAAVWSTDKLIARMSHFHKKGENLGYMGDKRKQLVLRDGFDSKNASHLIRLLRMCIEFLNTGEMIVERPDREELLSIKAGKWKLEDIKALAASLFEQAKQARDASILPERPDYGRAEGLLVDLLYGSLFCSKERSL